MLYFAMLLRILNIEAEYFILEEATFPLQRFHFRQSSGRLLLHIHIGCIKQAARIWKPRSHHLFVFGS